MASKKQKLKELNSLKGNWSAAHISINYKTGIQNDTCVHTQFDAFNIVDSIWDRELINLQEQFVALYFNGNNQLI